MSWIMQDGVLVLDATSVVGFGLVAALLEAGSPVLAVDRDPVRLQALQQQFEAEPALQWLQGSSDDDAAARALAEIVRQRAPALRAVLACTGCPEDSGRLLDRPADFLQQQLVRGVLPHLHAARHLLPLLPERDGQYLLVGGIGADAPWSGYGHVSVTSASLQMLVRVLHEEAKPRGVRVCMLAVGHPVATADNQRSACPEWPSALAIGRCAVALLAGARAEAIGPVVPYRGERAKPPERVLFPRFPASLLDAGGAPPGVAAMA